jgi:hypothetical protein
MVQPGAKWRIVMCLLASSACAFLAGCSNDGDHCPDCVGHGIVGPGPEYWARLYDWTDLETWPDPSLWSDDKLRSFAYSGSRGHPGFYQEAPSRGAPYYENTISLRLEPDKWIELSAATRDSAFAWSERSARLSAYYRDLVSESETEKYFEFRRVYSAHPSDVILNRVHKLSYLDRSMYDRLHPSPILGIFEVRPIDAANARELIEYMWANCRLVDFGRPLSRGLAESPSGFTEEIYFCYTIGADWGLCDKIGLGRARVSVDRTTGEITSTVEELREVNGVCYE